METWCVYYKFYSGMQWVHSSMYAEADSPEQAKAKVQGLLEKNSYPFQIIKVLMVGEGR